LRAPKLLKQAHTHTSGFGIATGRYKTRERARHETDKTGRNVPLNLKLEKGNSQSPGAWKVPGRLRRFLYRGALQNTVTIFKNAACSKIHQQGSGKQRKPALEQNYAELPSTVSHRSLQFCSHQAKALKVDEVLAGNTNFLHRLEQWDLLGQELHELVVPERTRRGNQCSLQHKLNQHELYRNTAKKPRSFQR